MSEELKTNMASNLSANNECSCLHKLDLSENLTTGCVIQQGVNNTNSLVIVKSDDGLGKQVHSASRFWGLIQQLYI